MVWWKQRINHACNPNAFVMFSKQGVSMGIKAYRAIEAGEEITVSCPFIFSPPAHILPCSKTLTL
jgi:SET domain-containing protein